MYNKIISKFKEYIVDCTERMVRTEIIEIISRLIVLTTKNKVKYINLSFPTKKKKMYNCTDTMHQFQQWQRNQI